jgi:hypothetical protein
MAFGVLLFSSVIKHEHEPKSKASFSHRLHFLILTNAKKPLERRNNGAIRPQTEWFHGDIISQGPTLFNEFQRLLF